MMNSSMRQFKNTLGSQPDSLGCGWLDCREEGEETLPWLSGTLLVMARGPKALVAAGPERQLSAYSSDGSADVCRGSKTETHVWCRAGIWTAWRGGICILAYSQTRCLSAHGTRASLSRGAKEWTHLREISKCDSWTRSLSTNWEPC